jgi:hypothetical protein
MLLVFKEVFLLQTGKTSADFPICLTSYGKVVWESNMSNNQQMSVSRKRLVAFMSMVT